MGMVVDPPLNYPESTRIFSMMKMAFLFLLIQKYVSIRAIKIFLINLFLLSDVSMIRAMNTVCSHVSTSMEGSGSIFQIEGMETLGA